MLLPLLRILLVVQMQLQVSPPDVWQQLQETSMLTDVPPPQEGRLLRSNEARRQLPRRCASTLDSSR